MTTRQLRRRVREHALGIIAARDEEDLNMLKPVPRHFKIQHDCDPKKLRVRGIDRVLFGQRGGDWKWILAQRETKWVYTLDTMVPRGLNDHMGFIPFI